MSAVRTTCPFCLNGCESIVTFDYQFRMEYPLDAPVNKGRLCPRGNSASIVVDHPKRLAYPLLDGKEVTWDQAMQYIGSAMDGARPEEIAVVYSRGMTESEVRLAWGFAHAVGTQNLVCGYIEPDNCFQYRLAGVRAATIEQVKTARTTLLVGDVFSTSPVAAGPVLEARYADRKNRLIVIDSIRTRQAGQAHVFLQVRPGTEVFALLGMVGGPDKGLGADVEQCAAVSGVSGKQLADAAQMLLNGPSFVGSAMHLGRVYHPVQHSLMSQLVAVKAGATFMGFGEARVPFGKAGFEEFRRQVESGSLKTVFWFGGMYPYSYPELMSELTGHVQFRVATSIFRPENALPGLVLPVPSELEKESVGHSYWGEVSRHPVAAAYNGARPLARVLADLAKVTEQPAEPMPEASTGEAVEMTLAALSGHRQAPVGAGFCLLGEKRASGIGGFFDAEDEIRLSAPDAAKLGVGNGQYVQVESATGKAEFRARVTAAVPEGAMSIGVNAHRNRVLFPLATDVASGETVIAPAQVHVAKSARASKPAVEMIARAG
jgi:anaerobic selenocysteine-containing dehydrogenase